MVSLRQRPLTDKLILTLLSLVMLFPAVDYILRNKLPIPYLASLWHNLALLALLAFVGIKIVFKAPERRSKISGAIGVLMLAGLAYTVLNVVDFGVNLEGFRAMFQYMLFFFAGFYLLDNNEDVKFLLSLAVVLGTAMALHGIYQYATHATMPAGWVDVGEAKRTRAFSILTSPNVFGSQLAFLTSIAAGLAAAEKAWAKKLLWLAAAGILGVGLIATGSRGAWLALAGGMAVIGIVYDRRLLFAGIAAAVLIAFFVPSVSARITYLFTPEYMEKSAGSGRIKRWLDAYDQMRLEPLFGAGLGHYGGAVASRNFNVPYVDNYYMKTLAETGLLGLSLFLWLIYTSLRQSYKAWQLLTDPRWRSLAAGLFGGLMAIAFHNAVENIFEVPFLNIYFWLAMGLLAGMPYNHHAAGGVKHE